MGWVPLDIIPTARDNSDRVRSNADGTECAGPWSLCIQGMIGLFRPLMRIIILMNRW